MSPDFQFLFGLSLLISGPVTWYRFNIDPVISFLFSFCGTIIVLRYYCGI